MQDWQVRGRPIWLGHFSGLQYMICPDIISSLHGLLANQVDLWPLGYLLPSLESRISALKETAWMPWWEGKEELALMRTGTHLLSTIWEWRCSVGGKRRGGWDREGRGEQERRGKEEEGGRGKGEGKEGGEKRGRRKGEGKRGEEGEGGKGGKKGGRGKGKRGEGERRRGGEKEEGEWERTGEGGEEELSQLCTRYHTHTTHIPVLAKLLRAEEPVKWTPLWSGDASRACTILGIAPSSPTFIRQSSANIQW